MIQLSPLLIQVLATADNKLGPINAEKAFAAIHQSLKTDESFTLQFAVRDQLAGMFLRFDNRLAEKMLDPFQANYPHVEQVRVKKSATPENFETWTAELQLKREVFALRSYKEFEDLLDRNLNDPVSGLLKSIQAGNRRTTHARIEILVQPATRSHVLIAHRAIQRLQNPFFDRNQWLRDWFADWRVHPSWWKRATAWLFVVVLRIQKTAHTNEVTREALEKVGRHCFDIRMRIVVATASDNRRLVQRTMETIAGAFGQFTSPNRAVFRLGKLRFNKKGSRERGFLLSDHELATLFHPTTELVKSPRTKKNESRRLEPPVFLPSPLGEDVLFDGSSQSRFERYLRGLH